VADKQTSADREFRPHSATEMDGASGTLTSDTVMVAEVALLMLPSASVAKKDIVLSPSASVSERDQSPKASTVVVALSKSWDMRDRAWAVPVKATVSSSLVAGKGEGDVIEGASGGIESINMVLDVAREGLPKKSVDTNEMVVVPCGRESASIQSPTISTVVVALSKSWEITENASPLPLNIISVVEACVSSCGDNIVGEVGATVSTKKVFEVGSESFPATSLAMNSIVVVPSGRIKFSVQEPPVAVVSLPPRLSLTKDPTSAVPTTVSVLVDALYGNAGESIIGASGDVVSGGGAVLPPPPPPPDDPPPPPPDDPPPPPKTCRYPSTPTEAEDAGACAGVEGIGVGDTTGTAVGAETCESDGTATVATGVVRTVCAICTGDGACREGVGFEIGICVCAEATGLL